MQTFNKKLIQRNFARKAKSYDAHARLQKRVVMELLSRAGKLDGNVLDIGSGTGLIAANASFSPIEVDLALPMCEQSASRGGAAVNADAEQLPFADASFDHAISSLTIQWLNNLDEFAAELLRVLKPNGTFHISTFGTGTLHELEFAFNFLDQDTHLLKFASSIYLFAVLKKHGFTKLEIHAQKIVYKHKNVMEILQQMKNIGATYPLQKAHVGFRGKRYFAKLENAYRSKYADDSGMLAATWNVLYITGRRPS